MSRTARHDRTYQASGRIAESSTPKVTAYSRNAIRGCQQDHRAHDCRARKGNYGKGQKQNAEGPPVHCVARSNSVIQLAAPGCGALKLAHVIPLRLANVPAGSLSRPDLYVATKALIDVNT
jgi:hypothetical protein